MPTLKVRKIINLAGSKVVALPPEWLRWLQTRYGVEPKEVYVETNGCVIIKPKLNVPEAGRA